MNNYEAWKLSHVVEKLIVLDKPLLIHVGFDREGDFMKLVQEFPRLKLIIAHAGFPYYSDTLKKIKEHKNVCVDQSQTSYVGEKITKEVMKFLGVERCILGTDGTFGFHGDDGKYDYGYIKRRIAKLFPDKGIQKRLLGENFSEISGIR